MAAEYSIYVFSTLCLLYVIQLIIALVRAAQPMKHLFDSTERVISIHQAAKVFDGGLRNNFWTFGVLAIFLPVVLAVLSNAITSVSLLQGSAQMGDLGRALRLALDDIETTAVIDSSVVAQFTTSFLGYYETLSRQGFLPPPGFLVHLFVTIIIVLIALEFSYIHNLRRVRSDWISMLLVASTLDFATILAIVLASRHTLDIYILPFMGVTTALALLSTYFVLVYSRISGALSEGQVRWQEFVEEIEKIREETRNRLSQRLEQLGETDREDPT